ncbi:hypothetical protein KXW17_002611 [Aspergillus fumigatus]|nr:hypothetical protein KXW17_002611 [Aspergillus fumigatus]
MYLIATSIEINAPPATVREKFLDFSSISKYSPNGFIRSISAVDPTKSSTDLQPGDKFNVCAGYGKMKFSPVVSSNTQSMFSWVGSVPGIFTGEHVFRFEEIPASEQGQSRTRYVGLAEDSRKGFAGFNHDFKAWVEEERAE